MPRGRFIDPLNKGFDRKLTLFSAPAGGSGKTTLLAKWSAQIEHSVAWLSLDKGDNDLGRFFAHFVGALQHTESKFVGQAFAFLQSTRPQSAQAVLVRLMNEIADKLGPFALVPMTIARSRTSPSTKQLHTCQIIFHLRCTW